MAGRRSLAAIGLAVLVASAAMPAARAQDEQYRQLAEDAARAMSERRLPEALTIFREMHAMAPSARTLWSLGRVHYELAEYVVAIDYLEQALADPRRALEGEPREQATALRDRALALVAEVDVQVTPPEATILLDDVVAREPRVRLDPGEHVIRFELAGHQATVRRIVVRGGERETLRVELAPVAGAAVATGPAPPRDVTIEVRASEPGLRLHLQPLAASGTPGPIGPMEPVCSAPCVHTVRTGAYAGAVSRGEGGTAPAYMPFEVAGDTTLEIAFRDESGTRIGGTIGVLTAVVIGTVGIIVGGYFLESGTDHYDSGAGVALLTTGITLSALSLSGLAFVFSADFAEIRAVPR